MVKDLLGWLIEKADARSMQRLLLRLSLLVIVLLALSSEFPLMVDAARLPFSYVELRHDTFEINAERRLYQISVQNLGTVKADTVRIRVRTAGGKPTCCRPRKARSRFVCVLTRTCRLRQSRASRSICKNWRLA